MNVRFFGLIKFQIKMSYININAEDIDELLNKICSQVSGIKIEILKSSVIYVNGKNIINMDKFKTKLNENDEVQILSPYAGG